MKVEFGLKMLKTSLSLKEALRYSLERRLDIKAYRRSIGDGHAKRRPRPCGLTIHTCIGCPFTCTYCYIDDLGFSRGRFQPYSLSGEEWLLALNSNPFFLPGVQGTYLSFGSVGEPLHGPCLDVTLNYLKRVKEQLLNPCQVATKSSLSEEAVDKLFSSSPPSINILVTIVTLNKSQALEPGAPSPQERFETLKRLRRKRLYAYLFLRPLIPGLEDELDELLSEAKHAGVLGVVVGGLRLSPRIYARLRSLGFKVPRVEEGLVDVPQRELKELVVKAVREKGLIAFRSACCATTYSTSLALGTKLPCAGLCFTSKLCTNCPVKCSKNLPKISEEEVLEAAAYVLGVRPKSARLLDGLVELVLEPGQNVRKGGLELLQLALRRRVKLLR